MDNLDQMMMTNLMLEDGQQPEILCSRVTDKQVPRLPTIASLNKFRKLEKKGGKYRGRGRANVLREYRTKLKESRPGKQESKESVAMVPDKHKSSHDLEPNQHCNSHWEEEDFPKLGSGKGLSNRQTKRPSEHTDYEVSAGEGKTKEITGATRSTHDTDFISTRSLGENDTSSLTDSLIQNDNSVVRPKIRKVEKFNHTEHYKNLFKEFQSISDSSMRSRRVMGLTRANLERHAKEMDSENIYRLEANEDIDNGEKNRTQSDNNIMESYEEYQVTLDDIQRFKHHQKQVPSNVKGRLASLLMADNDNDYKNDTAVGMCENVAELEREKEKFDCAIKDDEPLGAEGLASDGGQECNDSENVEAEFTNDSILSNLSDKELHSEDIYQSDTDENNVDGNLKTNNCANMQGNESLGPTSQLDEFTGDREETLNMENRSEGKCTDCEKMSNEDTQRREEITVPENESRLESEDPLPSSEKQMNEASALFIDHKINDVTDGVATCSYDFIDEDLEEFQEVRYKHRKKKKCSNKDSPDSHSSNSRKSPEIDNTIWRLYGPLVIQISGLPADFDVTILLEVVSGFGKITDYQVRNIDSSCSVRVMFSTEDEGAYAVQTLHDTDCLFADANCVLQCEKLLY